MKHLAVGQTTKERYCLNYQHGFLFCTNPPGVFWDDVYECWWDVESLWDDEMAEVTLVATVKDGKPPVEVRSGEEGKAVLLNSKGFWNDR